MIEGVAKCKQGFIAESIMTDFTVSIPPKRKVKYRRFGNQILIVQKDFVWKTTVEKFNELFEVVE